MQRSIIIDGEASDWYESATFILKDSRDAQLPHNLTRYAEEILENNLKIGNYKENKKRIQAYQNNAVDLKTAHYKKNEKWIDIFMVISICSLCIVLIGYYM